VGECFFWYQPTRVVPDKGPLNGCVCVRCLLPVWPPVMGVTGNKCIAARKVATPLRELTCHSVICHPAEVTFPPLPQPKLVLD